MLHCKLKICYSILDTESVMLVSASLVLRENLLYRGNNNPFLVLRLEERGNALEFGLFKQGQDGHTMRTIHGE